jgi:hypothetical protein
MFSYTLQALVIILLIAWFDLLLVQFGTNYFSVVSNFALALTMAWFSLLLVQFSTNSYSLVSTLLSIIYGFILLEFGTIQC